MTTAQPPTRPSLNDNPPDLPVDQRPSAAVPTDRDAELLHRVKSGQPAATEAFVRIHSPRMLATARRFLNNEHDSQDAVQDAFISAFKALSVFDHRARVETWLHRIVVNVCLMRLRAKRSRREQLSLLLPSFDTDGRFDEPVHAWHDRSVHEAEARELRRHVRECIDRLPERYRFVLILRDIEEYDTRRTAELLQCTPGSVKIRLHRARQALRTLLEPFVLESQDASRRRRV